VPRLTLVLVLHAHRAHGSLDHEVDDACARAYEPLLGWLESHPALRCALHVSGPLLDHLEARRPDLVDRVAARVRAGQVEPWGGGIGEPLLAALPPPARREQVEAMADRVESRFGVRPRGAWLARGAWEPSLAADLPEAGVQAVVLDDARLAAAGVTPNGLWGWHRTEHAGRTLALLPARRALRDLIRADEPEHAIAWLFRGASERDTALAVVAERVERWGVRAGGRTSAWEGGALERLAGALAANPWIEVRTPVEALASHPPLGLAWPAPGAGGWALPPEARARRREARALLAPRFGEAAEALLAPASPLQPLARFPEANRLHRRALAAARRLADDPRRHTPEGRLVRERLWRAHGADALGPAPSGGIHRPHLRAAAWADVIGAERFLAPADSRAEVADFDLDGEEDARLETPRWAAWLGARGGAMWGFDDRERMWNACDTIAEHDECGASVEPRRRGVFLDAWVESAGGRDWSGDAFALTAEAGQVRLVAPPGPGPRLEKRFAVGADGALEVEYVLRSERPRLGRLDVSVDLGLHVPEADDRWLEVDGRPAEPRHVRARARHEGVTRVAWVDAWADRRLDLWTDRRAAFERAPIQSRCAGPEGPETIVQGLAGRLSFPAAIEAGRAWRVRFRLAAGRAGHPA
jgi:hypothetical protein